MISLSAVTQFFLRFQTDIDTNQKKKAELLCSASLFGGDEWN
jgi:hypothetical protein